MTSNALVTAAIWTAYGKLLKDASLRVIDALHVYRARFNELGEANPRTSEAWWDLEKAIGRLDLIVEASPDE